LPPICSATTTNRLSRILDIHFAFGVKRAFNQVEINEELAPQMQDEVDEIDDLPLSDLFDHLEEWYMNTDFDEVQDALDILSELIAADCDRFGALTTEPFLSAGAQH